MELNITTAKGAKITLKAHAAGVDASVNGKPHTSFAAKLAYDAEAGNHIALAGKVRATINDADLDVIRAWFSDAAVFKAAEIVRIGAEYEASQDGFSARMDARSSRQGVF